MLTRDIHISLSLVLSNVFKIDEIIEFHSEDSEYMQSLFNSYKLKHNKTYADKCEHDQRFEIFKQHAKRVTKHNLAFLNGTKSYYLSLNQHSDKVTIHYIRFYFLSQK